LMGMGKVLDPKDWTLWDSQNDLPSIEIYIEHYESRFMHVNQWYA
jgi:hypothetical protein